MNNHQSHNLVVVHISERAVYTVMGCQTPDKHLQIMAVGEATTDAFSRGVIIHRERLQNAIKKSIAMADMMANTRTHSVALVFASTSLLSGNAAAQIHVDDTVSSIHMAKVLTAAKERFYDGQDFYTSQYFLQMAWVDDSSPIQDVIGLEAKKLSASYHLMGLPTNEYNAWCNVLRGVDVDSEIFMCDMVAGASYSVLPEEKKSGVLFIDIGKRITKIALYKDDILLFTDCIGFGGDDITDAMSNQLLISFNQAQHLKHHYANLDITEADKQLFVETIKERQDQQAGVFSRHRISEIIVNCYNQLFDEIAKRLHDVGLEKAYYYTSGVVVAGGGSCVVGFVPYLKKYWQINVHLANDNERANSQHRIQVSNALSDENFKYVGRVIKDKNLQVALGALLYGFSDDYEETQNRHNPDYRKPKSLLEKIGLYLDKISSSITKWG